MAQSSSTVTKVMVTTDEILQYLEEIEGEKYPISSRPITSDKYTNSNIFLTPDRDPKKTAKREPFIIVGAVIALTQRTSTDDSQVDNVPVAEYTSALFKHLRTNFQPGKGLIFNRFGIDKKFRKIVSTEPEPFEVKTRPALHNYSTGGKGISGEGVKKNICNSPIRIQPKEIPKKKTVTRQKTVKKPFREAEKEEELTAPQPNTGKKYMPFKKLVKKNLLGGVRSKSIVNVSINKLSTVCLTGKK